MLRRRLARPGRDRPQPRRPGDHGRARAAARLAGRRLRRHRAGAVDRLHLAAAAAQGARARRARRARHLGAADGRRHLLLGGRRAAVAGLGGEPAVRAAVHQRAHGQAHRQDPVRRAVRHAHPAGACWATPGRGRRRSGCWWPSTRRPASPSPSARCPGRCCSSRSGCRCCGRSPGRCARRAPTSRRPASRSGRCGSPRSCSCTSGGPAGCCVLGLVLAAVLDVGLPLGGRG